MLLDEKLYKICTEKAGLIKESESMEYAMQASKDMIKALHNECSNYIITNTFHSMLKTDVKKVIDRSFKMYNIFVKKALSSQDKYVKTLAEIAEVHKFKDYFLSMPRKSEIYKNL